MERWARREPASGSLGLSFRAASASLERGLEVSAAPERDGEVVVIVLVGRVGGGGALVEGDGVLALAAEGDALVVDDLRQREAGGEELEGGVGTGVVGGVEAGEAEVEVGLEGLRVGERDLGERGCGGGVVAGEVLLLAECEEGCGVAGRGGDGGPEALERLGGGGCVDAADVVLEGGERDGAFAGAEEGLLGDVEGGVDGAGDLPGDGVLGVVEAVECGSVGDRRRERELVDGEDLGLDGDLAAGEGEAADDDVVGVELLGDADGGGAGGAEVAGKAEVREGEDAVVVGDGEEAGGVEAAIERVGEGVADPVEGGVAGAVLEGKDEDDASSGERLRDQRSGRERCEERGKIFL